MTPAPPLPPVWKTIRWPVWISLAVLVARLVGELLELDPRFFSREAGGGFAIVGMFWLVPVFGFAFGWILTGRGRAPDRPGLSIILHLLGLGALLSGLFFLVPILEYPLSLAVFAGTAVVSLLFALRAWPQLLRYTVTYGVLVRIAVVAVTAVAFAFDWGTHFEKINPDSDLAELTRTDQAVVLCAAQLLLWMPMTVLVGGVFGSVASMIRGRRADDAPDD